MQTLVNIIKNDGLVVVPTDTIYGIVALASSKKATEKVFALKGRDPSKPPIILITNLDQMFDQLPKQILHDIEPYLTDAKDKNSLILPSPTAPEWITRGTGSVAYRLITSTINTPNDAWSLYDLIDQTGPLIAPSANPENLPPAENISQAKQYFGDKIDFYIDKGTISGVKPSKLYRWTPNEMQRLR